MENKSTEELYDECSDITYLLDILDTAKVMLEENKVYYKKEISSIEAIIDSLEADYEKIKETINIKRKEEQKTIKEERDILNKQFDICDVRGRL